MQFHTPPYPLYILLVSEWGGLCTRSYVYVYVFRYIVPIVKTHQTHAHYIQQNKQHAYAETTTALLMPVQNMYTER